MGVVRRGNSKHWYIQFQFRGRTYIRSSRTTDKRAAEQIERDWRRELHAQVYLGRQERVSIQQAVESFCRSKEGTANHKNLIAHSHTLNRLLKTTRYLDEVSSEDLERVKRDKEREGTSPATLRHLFNLIRGTLKHARKLGYHVGDPHFPRIKSARHRLRYLTQDEEKRLLAELDPRREVKGLPPYAERHPELRREMWDGYDLVILLLDTGARYSEIAGLEWRQVNVKDRTLHLWRPKVQNESILYLTDRAARVLTRRNQEKDASPYVFKNSTGGKRGYASQGIRKAIRRAGLEGVSIHTFRHTHASRLIQNGLNLYEVREILGHTDIKTTMRYAHLERRDVSSKARDVINRLNKETEKPDLKIV